jgi:hypothetical protein
MYVARTGGGENEKACIITVGNREAKIPLGTFGNILDNNSKLNHKKETSVSED